MRILYLHQYYCPVGGSGNTRSRDFSRYWTLAGHSVTVITSFAHFPKDLTQGVDFREVKVFDFEGVNVHAIHIPYSHFDGFPKRVKSFLRFYWASKKYLQGHFKGEDFDIIYASSTPPTIGELGRKLSAQWQIPFVFETVDVWPDVPIGMEILRNKALGNWIQRRVNRIYDSAAHIVSLSEGMAEQVLSHGDWKDKISVIHNGTDIAQFASIANSGRGEVLHFAYTGTIGKANGLDHLVHAVKGLEDQGFSGFRVTVLGNGNDAERVKALAQKLAVKSITFLPTIPHTEIPAFLSSVDVGIVCFANYAVLEANSANKFFDYLAAGIPVMINYGGWQLPYIQENGAGLASERGDDAGFGRAMMAFVAMGNAQLDQMRLAARKVASTYFDRKELAAKVVGIFEKIRASHS